METVVYLIQIKNTIEKVEGCYTTTTAKKNSGFVPKNKWNIKWGQIDVNDKKILIVLDTIPGKYNEDTIKKITRIPIKPKGTRSTGFYIKKTDKAIPSYDAIVISINIEDLADMYILGLLDFIRLCAEESSFKTRHSY